ncbi:hypothetical protein DBP71_26290, partial [Salmonella enterica subsp. enterica serovar 4,[5],12:i:-]
STLGHDFLDIMDLVIHTLLNRTGKAWMPVTLFKHRREHFSHAAALRYIDARIDGLLNIFRQTGGETFVIVCSDHGTCYGEDG